jgi:hypothetical protein
MSGPARRWLGVSPTRARASAQAAFVVPPWVPSRDSVLPALTAPKVETVVRSHPGRTAGPSPAGGRGPKRLRRPALCASAEHHGRVRLRTPRVTSPAPKDTARKREQLHQVASTWVNSPFGNSWRGGAIAIFPPDVVPRNQKGGAARPEPGAAHDLSNELWTMIFLSVRWWPWVQRWVQPGIGRVLPPQ